MSEKNTGGQAFPLPCSASPMGGVHWGEQGMSLRDYFAAKALTAVIRKNGADFKPEEWDRRAREAYGFADAMIKARGVEC